MAECNLLPWWQNNSCENGLNHREFRNVVICCLLRSEREKWKTEVIAKPKLRTIELSRKGMNGYIERIRCKAQRSVVARLRGGTAPLEIETGIPPE